MAEPFLAEIRMMSFNFPPKGWAFCNGQLMPINQNQALFSLLGTTFGGDGRVNFALPNHRGRTPIGMGNGHTQGEAAGQESTTLTISQIPPHVHTLLATNSSTNNVPIPANNYLANAAPQEIYSSGSAPQFTPLAATTIGGTGGSQPHYNMQPYTVINFCIALQGIFPSQT